LAEGRGSARLRAAQAGSLTGRPRRIDEKTRERIVALSLSHPHDLGLPFHALVVAEAARPWRAPVVTLHASPL
jgi:hypothetical protein